MAIGETTHASDGYGAATVAVTNTDAAVTPHDDKKLRTALTATHALHWASSVIVLGIAAWLVAKYPTNVHMGFWVGLAAVDALIWLAMMVLPAARKYRGHAWPIPWIFSFLWLTAFIFAIQDYAGGAIAYSSPNLPFLDVGHHGLRRAIPAFAFLAMITALIATFLETCHWIRHRRVASVPITNPVVRPESIAV